MRQFVHHSIVSSIALVLATACTQGQVDRLRKVGQAPELNKVDAVKHSENVPWPAPATSTTPLKASPSSLWRQGSKDFFRDQRARKVGDILTVKIAVNDQAALDNKSESKRKGDESLGVPNLFGLEKQAIAALPGNPTAGSLLGVKSDSSNSGEGTIKRGEKVETQLAAVVTQVLDNGNLVIYGSQEIRVNYEVRQLTINGVIRPEDIEPNNFIDGSRIAEARVSYGGEGVISSVQQPRIGSQVVDILSPF